MITQADKTKVAEANANMEKWVKQQAKKRYTFRPVRLICMLGFVVWFACTYVWR